MYYTLVYFAFFITKSFISTWSGFAIYSSWQFPILALLYGNCPLTFKLRQYFAFLQKLPSLKVFCKMGCSLKFCRRAPVLQSLLNKGTGLRACILRGDSSVGVFPVWFVKFFRAPILMSICQQQLLIF